MKRTIIIIAAFLIKPVLFSQDAVDTAMVKKTGWLVYWDEQIIWVPSDIDNTVTNMGFFKDSLYNNGLILNGHYQASFLEMFAKPYRITQRIPKDDEDSHFKDSIWIIPVKAMIKYRDTDLDDLRVLSFNYNNYKTKLPYRFVDKYSVRDIEVLRKKDQKKLSRFLRKKRLTMDDIINQQKGAY